MRRTWKRALTALALAAPLALPASAFAQAGGATGTPPGSDIPDVGRPGEQAPKPPKTPRPDVPTDTRTRPEQLAPDTGEQPGRGEGEEQPAPQEKQPKPESELND
jgi:hypothetical protein